MTTKKAQILFFVILLAGILILPASADSSYWDVVANSDDAGFRRTSEWFSLTSWISLGDYSGTLYDYEGMFRFTNISIPQGATITGAWLEVQTPGIYGNDPDLIIFGQDSDDCVTFSTANNYKARPTTSASVSWTPSGWVADGRYNSTDMKSVVQEIVNRGGWASGNDMAIFVTHAIGWIGAEERTLIYAYDMDNAKAARLYIGWTVVATEPPSMFYGAGFNDSVPFVDLRWTHDLTVVDFFELQNSSNNIAWETLAFIGNTSTEYTDYEVENGTERYYRIRACRDLGAGWDNSSWITNFETVDFLVEIFINPLSGSWESFNVSSIHNMTGDYVHGNLSSTIFVDGFTYKVNEVTGVPGWDIRYNFTGVPENSTSLSVSAFADYEGNPAHDPHIEAWNFENASWVNVAMYGEGSFEWHNESLSIGGFIQSSTGKVWLRFIHHISGVGSHFINVDYIRLRAFVPTGGGGIANLDAWSINWLIGILWLGLTAIGIFKGEKILIMFAGFMGIILGLLLLTESAMVSIVLICLSLYLLYEGTQ